MGIMAYNSVLMDWGEIHLKYQQLFAAAFRAVLSQEKSPTGEPELIASAKYGMGRVAALRGEIGEAMQLAQESEAHFASLGHHKAAIVREWWQGLCVPVALIPSFIHQ